MMHCLAVATYYYMDDIPEKMHTISLNRNIDHKKNIHFKPKPVNYFCYLLA